MPGTQESLSSTLASVEQGVERATEAWASWRAAATNASLAAVMGTSIPATLRPNDVWNVTDSILSDRVLDREIASVEEEAPRLRGMIEDHISWILRQAEEELVTSIQTVVPTFQANGDPIREGGELTKLDKAFRRMTKLTKRVKIARQQAAALDEELRELQTKRTMTNSVVRDAQSNHAKQVEFITEQAGQLAFGDQAKEEVARKIESLKRNHVGNALDFFESSAYTTCQKQRERIEKERSHIELELQSFFDHFAHGASRTESSKPERTQLKLAHELEKGKSGFKQIQLVEAFCLGRGNEMWAIIPDLLRIGHDVHPTDLIHWQPPLSSAVPEPLRDYREEQNRAFAKRILHPSICSPGLRTRLLATHSHGVHKTSFKADPNDGCAIYWVMLQLFRPVDRDHRRELELSVAKMYSRFHTGNPSEPLADLCSKVREGMDIGARIRWDTTAIPLIDVLGSRDAMFTVELAKYRDLPPDPDDSIVELDAMISVISDTVQVLDKAKKNWEEKTAMVASNSHSKELKAMRAEIKALKASMSSDHPTHDTTNPNPKKRKRGLKAEVQLPKGVTKGHCWVKGCGRKIEKWSPQNNWKLCTTCLLKVKDSGQPAKLMDGTEWGRARALSAMGQMRKAGVSSLPESKRAKDVKLKKALKVLRRSKPEGESAFDVQDPDAEGEGCSRVDFDEDFDADTEELIRSLRNSRKVTRR